MMPLPNLREDQYEHLNSRSSNTQCGMGNNNVETRNHLRSLSQTSNSTTNMSQFVIKAPTQQNYYGSSSVNHSEMHPQSETQHQTPLTKAELRKVVNMYSNLRTTFMNCNARICKRIVVGVQNNDIDP